MYFAIRKRSAFPSDQTVEHNLFWISFIGCLENKYVTVLQRMIFLGRVAGRKPIAWKRPPRRGEAGASGEKTFRHGDYTHPNNLLSMTFRFKPHMLSVFFALHTSLLFFELALKIVRVKIVMGLFTMTLYER